MAYLNANIPVIYCQIRREYLYDLKRHHGEVEDCMVFGIASMPGRALLFHAIMENGGVYYRLPISAFIQHGFDVEKVPRMRLDELELWNSFSYYPSVTVYDALSISGKDWEVNHTIWSVEDSRDWQTEDTNKFFYGIEDKKNDKV